MAAMRSPGSIVADHSPGGEPAAICGELILVGADLWAGGSVDPGDDSRVRGVAGGDCLHMHELVALHGQPGVGGGTDAVVG